MRYKTIAAAVLLFLISSAAAAQDKKPAAQLKRVTINSIDWWDQTADATVTVEITNPAIAMRVKDVGYHLRLNGAQVAEGKLDREIHLAAVSTTDIDLPVTVRLRALPAALWNIITEGLTLRYEVKAEYALSVFGINTEKMKTAFSGDVAVMKALSEKIKEKVSGKPE
ncbi:MAG: LEA type 2 family protein [Acidobacteriota bacterium]